MVTCPHCGREARISDRFCQYCGQQLPGDGNYQASQPSPVYASTAGEPSAWPGAQAQPMPIGNTSSAPASGPTTAVQARLVVRPAPNVEPNSGVNPDEPEQEFTLDGRDIAVGRAPSCDIVLTGDQLASRRHALLRSKDGSYTVVDLGSSNGTYVNDMEIHAETPLADGDHITIGGHEVIYSTAPASPNASAAGVNMSDSQPSRVLLETNPSISSVNHEPIEDMPTEASPVDTAAPEAESAPAQEPQAAEAPADQEAAEAAEAGQQAPDEQPWQPDAEAENAGASYVFASSDDSNASSDEQPASAAPVVDHPVASDPSTPMTDEDLANLRDRLAEVSAALSRKADEEYRVAGRFRAVLVEVRDKLATLLREHGGEEYMSSPGAGSNEHAGELAQIARQAADHPRHLDYLSALADHAGEIADALEAAPQSPAGGDTSGDLVSGLEALRAMLDDTLGKA